MKKLLIALAWCVSVAIARADIYQINLNATNDESGILSGIFEVGPNASTATGGEVGGGIFYDNSTMSLTINAAYGLFGFSPLTGSFTATHLHQAAAGINGPVIINLDLGLTDIHTAIGPNAGIYSGSVPLTYAQEAALFANDIYINVHSSAFPGGEIRAQFIPTTVPEPATIVYLGAGAAILLLLRRRQN